MISKDMNKLAICGLVVLMGIASLQAETVDDDELKSRILAFFNSFARKDHGGAGSIKDTNLFHRSIRMAVNSLAANHAAKTTIADVTVKDLATGFEFREKAESDPGVLDTDGDAITLAGTEAAFKLFKLLELSGAISSSSLLEGLNVKLCTDVMREKTCQMYESNGMCKSDNWREYLRHNCFYTCFNCGAGWN